MPDTQEARKMVFFSAADAPSLDDEGMMSSAALDPAIAEEVDLGPYSNASKLSVLYRGAGPEGFSLVHVSFNPGFRLPRHTHNVDCLYYVVSGEIIMGSRRLHAGEGFFIRAGVTYAYEAGPQGVEVLEFRAATSFDIQILDQTVDRWRAIVNSLRVGGTAQAVDEPVPSS
ncbi:cupin domain-containing protein [Frankia sp. Ag45/Mut15]|uniref:Cupin domain-containing protein n=1 Tax=Frankia umida TaxID=573489 RepID=A0ABT0K078_9ACTN|nr:cupin domain-containing protein [Frankia umida]MCK9877131.1 cupin domain-containing protein [Frankia umida]